MDFNRLADVLEKTANYLDNQEAEKTAAAQDARRQLVNEFSERYTAATGEDLSEQIVEKLAASDENLLALFQKLAARIESNTNEAPDDLGEPGDMPDSDPVYTTKKAALAANVKSAEDNFLSFIMGE